MFTADIDFLTTGRFFGEELMGTARHVGRLSANEKPAKDQVREIALCLDILQNYSQLLIAKSYISSHGQAALINSNRGRCHAVSMAVEYFKVMIKACGWRKKEVGRQTDSRNRLGLSSPSPSSKDHICLDFSQLKNLRINESK